MMNWQVFLSFLTLCASLGVSITLILVWMRATYHVPSTDNKLFLVFLIFIFTQNLLFFKTLFAPIFTLNQLNNFVSSSKLDTQTYILLDIVASFVFYWVCVIISQRDANFFWGGALMAFLGLVFILSGPSRIDLIAFFPVALYLGSLLLAQGAAKKGEKIAFTVIASLLLVEIGLRRFSTLPFALSSFAMASTLGYLGYFVFWKELVDEIIKKNNQLNQEVQEKEAARQQIEQLNQELKLAYDTTLDGWARALELRDKEIEGHSRRVTELTLSLARAIGITGDDLMHIQHGALLHDIGKMAIPDKILHKPGSLTAKEREEVKEHPTIAYNLLKDIAFLQKAIDIPYAHHEHWDGTGYPRSLKGESIPLAARIFAIADAWDAIRQDRIYDKGRSEAEAITELKRCAGTQFDPHLVDIFINEIIKTLPS